MLILVSQFLQDDGSSLRLNNREEVEGEWKESERERLLPIPPMCFFILIVDNLHAARRIPADW